MKKVAIIYDFDETLSPKNMFDFSILPDLGYEETDVFWNKVMVTAKEKEMDYISTYLYLLKEAFREKGIPMTKKLLHSYGSKIPLCMGVETWFQRIREFGKSLDLEVEHYIISSGLKEILEGLPFSSDFTRIYACSYFYDEHQEAIWPSQIINYTTKTQFIFRINKQVLSETSSDINSYVSLEERPIPISRMMYIGDGFTDVPCMRLIKEYKGKSIVVYQENQPEAMKVGNTLLQDGRASIMVPADYSEESPLDQYVKQNLIYIKEKLKRKELEKQTWIK